MNEVWVAVIATVGTTVAAMLGVFGVYVRLRREREIKQIENDASTEVAVIHTESNERIHMVDTLMARVNALEQETQVKDKMIIDLTREASVATAKFQLQEAERKMLTRENEQLNASVAALHDEMRLLKHQLQSEVSEALSTLEESSKDG